MKEIARIALVFSVIGMLYGCKQSDPPNFGRTGDLVLFSDYEWDIKHSTSLLGPGPNLFSNL